MSLSPGAHGASQPTLERAALDQQRNRSDQPPVLPSRPLHCRESTDLQTYHVGVDLVDDSQLLVSSQHRAGEKRNLTRDCLRYCQFRNLGLTSGKCSFLA
eukprot:766751-Hanusia_phi.AAC.22